MENGSPGSRKPTVPADEHTTPRERWRSMSPWQRLCYFKDYYLLKLVIAVAAICLAGILIWQAVKPRQTPVLHVAVLTESLDVDETLALENRLAEEWGGAVSLDDTFGADGDVLTKLQVYLNSAQLDVIVAPADVFDQLAGYGYFQSLPDELLTQAGGRTVVARGYLDSGEISLDDRQTGQGESLPYGIDLTQSETYRTLGAVAETPVAGIVVNAPNMGHSQDFLTLLLQAE